MEVSSTVEQRLDRLQEDMAALVKELADLNEDVHRLQPRTLLPRTLLLSGSLLLRSLAVWGHYLLGQILIAIPVSFVIAA